MVFAQDQVQFPVNSPSWPFLLTRNTPYRSRMNRWSKNCVLDRVFEQLQKQQIVRLRPEAASLDSTSVKVHPDGLGAPKNVAQAIGKSPGGWTTKIHLVAADARTAPTFPVSPGQAYDAPEGRKLLRDRGPRQGQPCWAMEPAYEGTRHGSWHWTWDVLASLKTRVEPWECDRAMYKRRNDVERLFRRLKGLRRIFTRFEKLDVLFLGVILVAPIFHALLQ